MESTDSFRPTQFGRLWPQVRIDQLALLLAVVVAANVVLLIALELPRLGRRARSEGDSAGDSDGPDSWGESAAGDRDGPDSWGQSAADFGEYRSVTVQSADARMIPSLVYQRVVRVVAFLFIGAVLVVSILTGGSTQVAIFLWLALGVFLIVLFQDLLPPRTLGRWRAPIEASSAIVFVTVLVTLSGGHASPYFFGFILLVGAAALWSAGYGPPLLAAIASAAYLLAVLIAGPLPLSQDAFGLVTFNLVALALITYVAAVIGREQRRAREAALRLSRFDLLTGLYSRAYLTGTVEQEIRRAARTGRPFGMLMIDLDGLKAANDRFGHDSGDQLLRAVADILRRDIRVTDTAARYAGDEFVLILPETDVSGAILVAEKIRVDIARLAIAHERAVIRTTASIGLVTYPDDGRTSAELMRRADLAMYEAKRRGRDQIVRFAHPEPPVVDQRVPVGAPASSPASPPTSPPPGGAPPPVVPRPSPGPVPWEPSRR